MAMTRCQFHSDCPNSAAGLYRIFPTGREVRLCAVCAAVMTEMGVAMRPVESGWLARAIRNELPPRVDLGR